MNSPAPQQMTRAVVFFNPFSGSGGSAERAHELAEHMRRSGIEVTEVETDAAGESFRRDDAWYWAGVVWRAEDQLDDARNAWRRVAEHGVDPLDRILAFDAIALSYVELGDLEAAAGVLNQCLAALSERALEETSEGERVRNALLRMRVVDELQRAIARKNHSSEETRSSRNP